MSSNEKEYLDPNYDLARNFLDIRYQSLPPNAVKVAEYQILDTLGVALGDSTKAGIKELITLLRDLGGRQSVYI